MRSDFHLHSKYSNDCQMEPSDIAAQAVFLGLEEICITDHVDFDETAFCNPPANMERCHAEVEILRRTYPTLKIRRGAEIGLGDAAVAQATLSHIGASDLDCVIGSVHWVDGFGNPIKPEYYQEKTKEDAYRLYVEAIARRMTSTDIYQVLGHFDFVAKWAPYPERALLYQHAPDAFDTIFRYIIPRGIVLEYNMSPYRSPDQALWGMDVLKRYCELGGEAVSIGSDAHRRERIGYRISDGQKAAKAIGIPYLATFVKRKPIYHKLKD